VIRETDPDPRVPHAERREGQPASQARPAGAAPGLTEELAGLREVLRSLVVLQVARGKVALERSGLALVRLALFGVAGLVLVASTVVLIVIGSVGGLSAALNWPWWLSALTLGVVGPVVAAAVIQLMLHSRDSSRARALERKTQRDGGAA